MGMLEWGMKWLPAGWGQRVEADPCESICREEQAKKGTYNRAFREDGTYHYPRIEENLLCKKGEVYFESWEITGSREEKNGAKKFSLKKWLEEKYTPAVLTLAQQIESETGKRVLLEMDGTMQLHTQKEDC